MKPTMNRVLVVVEEKDAKVPTQIINAEVVEIGPEVKRIKVKDRVCFSPFGYDEVMVDGKKMVVISEDMILGVYNGSTGKKIKG